MVSKIRSNFPEKIKILMQRRRMMFTRLHFCVPTSTLGGLLFSPLSSSYAAMSTQSSNQVEGCRSFLSVNIHTAQGSTAEKISPLETIANQDISCTSNILLKQSGDGKECSSLSLGYTTTSVTEHQPGSNVQSDQLLEPVLQRDDDILYSTGFTRLLEEHCLPTSFGKKELYKYRNLRSVHHCSEHVTPGSRNKKSKYHNIRKTRIIPEPFDIYQCETEGSDTEMNDSREINNNTEEPRVVERIQEPMQSVPRPGMVLLKKYISPEEQVSIIRKCRELGLGPGGFYQPGYKNGWKLRLQMMCLGLDWDPQTRKYQKRRRIDKAKPPDIPSEFRLLVTSAMEDSLSLTRKIFNSSNAEKILPRMTPDICIVNFYTETGRLGLHQDRDESEESLSKGLPVVSFSIGDTAEFMYGDKRDANEANKLELESGDVLIFGGESRHVFHGISSIIPHSAPDFLREQTMLRCGRLNLTFRRY